MANISPNIVFGISFLILSNANIDFLDQKLRWRTYITKKALSTTRYIKLVEKKEFVAIVLDPKYKTFVVYIVSLGSATSPISIPLNIDIHFFHKIQIAGLIVKEISRKISDKYMNFVDVFSLDLTFELLEHNEIYDHAIKLVDDQQPLYKLIYSLEPVELETLKAYIEINLAN